MGEVADKAPQAVAFAPRARRRGLRYWLLLALLVHLELGLVTGLAIYFLAPRDADLAARLEREAASGDRVDLGIVDDEAARKILAELDREAEKAKEEAIKKEEEAPQAPGQVVELPKPVNQERPENAKYAAEYDSSVAKETRKLGRFDKNARQGSTSGEAEQTTPAQPVTAARPAQPGTPGKTSAAPRLLALRTPGPTTRPGPPAPSPSPEPTRAPSGQSPETEPGPPDGEGTLLPSGRLLLRPPGGGGGRPEVPGSSPLLPSEQQVARAVGSGTDDYLKDVDDGEETALNAKRWKHAAFFNRVKQQVRDHWRPADVYRQHDPTFRIYGQRDRFTLLRVALKPDGSLADVVLETPSGVDFLDDEAIEAFKQAQPFPNPPRQLITATGLISFRFGFYFEIGGAPRMKIFRYGDQM